MLDGSTLWSVQYLRGGFDNRVDRRPQAGQHDGCGGPDDVDRQMAGDTIIENGHEPPFRNLIPHQPMGHQAKPLPRSDRRECKQAAFEKQSRPRMPCRQLAVRLPELPLRRPAIFRTADQIMTSQIFDRLGLPATIEIAARAAQDELLRAQPPGNQPAGIREFADTNGQIDPVVGEIEMLD